MTTEGPSARFPAEHSATKQHHRSAFSDHEHKLESPERSIGMRWYFAPAALAFSAELDLQLTILPYLTFVKSKETVFQA